MRVAYNRCRLLQAMKPEDEDGFNKPLPELSYEGSGDAGYGNGFSVNVQFKLQQHKNGVITGELQFQDYYEALWSYYKQTAAFTLNGKESKNGRSIVANGSYLTGLDESDKRARFGSREILVSPDVLDIKYTGKLHLHFGIMNVYEVYRSVNVETNLGPLKLKNFGNIKEAEEVMSLYHVPSITSGLEIVARADGSASIRSIVENATKIVWDFLKITSLAQTIWHDWASLEVSEVLDENEYQMHIKPIFHKLRSPKTGAPYIRMNAMAIYLETFVRSAWKGYSSDLLEKYGFDTALEWYVQANAGFLLETKFLSATTCLEMLMDKFHSQNKTDKLLDDERFEIYFDNLKRYAREILLQMEVEEATRAAIYNSMKGMQRRSFVDKFDMLLKFWGISYSDTGVTLEEIKDVRNKITHQGKYAEKPTFESVDYLSKLYNGLFNILTRIFLAMLKYDAEYFDPPNSRWIRFRDVCKGEMPN
jgi:hypothetical protein